MELLEKFGRNFKERVDNAIEKMRKSNGIILIDDEDRENEGDIIYPAETINEVDMALLIRECSGIVCLCITKEKAESLNLKPMVYDNTSKNQTAFTVSIEAKENVTTGVSAKDRITTIKTAISKTSKPSDLSRPGHVFPLIAKDGGVLERRGHTEGSVDLVKLAGLGDSAVLCELTNEDGTMAKLPEIVNFAIERNMSVLSVQDIINYKLNN